jgi:hypothetical protein
MSGLHPTPAEMEHSTLIIGMTGSGKSEGMKVEAADTRDAREYAQVVIDGQGKLVEEILADNVAKGHEAGTEYLVLADDKVVGLEFLKWSTATGLQRDLEDDRGTVPNPTEHYGERDLTVDVTASAPS